MKLRDYLTRNGISRSKAASDLGVHRVHLDSIICGIRMCSYDLASRIQEYTQGNVSIETMMENYKVYHCPCCNRRVSEKNFLEITTKKLPEMAKNMLDQKMAED